MIARFATIAEIDEARKRIAASEEDGSRKRKKEMDPQGFSYSWSTEQKVRPGLNVFDEKGNELEWDYEHDTRFFDDPNASEGKDEKTASPSKEAGAPQAKGRGAKKGSFLFNGAGGTLASDEIDETTIKRRRLAARLAVEDEEEEDDDEEEVWRQKPSSPTPQPWDRPKDLSYEHPKRSDEAMFWVALILLHFMMFQNFPLYFLWCSKPMKTLLMGYGN
ncbi:unnamed protein product [Nippostrongylus brasiliensis]|uniref:DDT domain-containing protein n=1 Tax=Nippostrongylus brasiliensis TaxID=27835 RepID=A0A0N4XY16_NIPBR|nr:unnamed protein product [Nippostrongylus brasiliensis]